jgi:hypothetical protein
LVRAFNGDRIDQLLSDNGLFLVERLRVRRPPVGPTPDPPLWPTAVLAFLAADEDADTDHYVVVASPAAGARGSPVSLAAELQHRLHRSEDELAELQADLATLEHAMECLQLDIGLKDDFALELRGRVKSAEAGLARVEGELAQARAALERTRDEVLERERELDELRGRHGTGLLPHLVARLRHQLGNTRRQ